MQEKKNQQSPEGCSTDIAKKQALFERQRNVLDTFLSTNAISKAQYQHSLNCLAEKMGIHLEDDVPLSSDSETTLSAKRR